MCPPLSPSNRYPTMGRTGIVCGFITTDPLLSQHCGEACLQPAITQDDHSQHDSSWIPCTLATAPSSPTHTSIRLPSTPIIYSALQTRPTSPLHPFRPPQTTGLRITRCSRAEFASQLIRWARPAPIRNSSANYGRHLPVRANTHPNFPSFSS